MTLSDTDLEARLRRELRARADDVPPAPRNLAELTRQRHRSLRRREYGLAAAALAAVVVFVGVPVVASTVAVDDDRGRTAQPSPSGGPVTPDNLASVPTRGSLAGDDEWLHGVLGLDWVPETTLGLPGMVEIDPAVDSRTVAFAGDVPGGRVALVLGRWGSRWAHAWFVGPADAAPGDMELAADPSETVLGEPLALLDLPDRGSDQVTLVVVGFPGDTARALTGRDVDGTGETVEQWQDLPMEDGAAAGALAVTGLDLQMNGGIWVQHGGGQPLQVLPQVSDRSFVLQFSDVDVADPRGLGGGIDDDLVQTAARCLIGQFGIAPEQFGLTLLAGGPLGGSSMNQAALVGGTFASGAATACLVTQQTTPDPGSVTMTSTLVDPLPPNELLRNQVIAVPAGNWIVVSGPGAGRTAEIRLPDGTVVASVPLVDGAGVGSLPPSTPATGEPATVAILSGSGRLIVEAPVTDPAS